MTTTTSTSNAATRSVQYGGAVECGDDAAQRDRQDRGNDRFDNSVELAVDDSQAPSHFLVTVKYGLYCKGEGWIYNSFKLKLAPDQAGNLRYDLVEGDGANLFSTDKRVQAGPLIRYSHNYRLSFFCVASLFGDRSKITIQKQVSLCLKVA